MIGLKAQQHPELVAQVKSSGHHVIGNHSWDHPNFHDISVVAQIREVLRNEAVLAEEMRPKLFRYPYGNSSCETNQFLHSRGYRIVGWHVDSCDWAFDKDGSVDAKEALSCGVLPQHRGDYAGHVVSSVRAHNGGIVLLHEIHPNTVQKLDDIIVRIAAEGFIFGTIDEAAFQTSMR